MLLFALVVTLSLLFSFLCSLAEATLLSVGQARIEALVRSGSAAGLVLRRFKKEPDRPIAAILVLNTVANSGGAAIATDQFAQAFPLVSPVWFAAAFVVTVLTLTEIVPKTIGVVHANSFAVPVAHAVRITVTALLPVLWLTRLVSRLFSRNPVVHSSSLEEIRLLATSGYSQGAFGPITATLIENATRLRDTKARDVMVPRSRISYLSGTVSTEANLDRIHRSGHSRFPYTPTGELDGVTGVILTKELLFSLRERTEPDWEELLVPMLIVPQTATLNHLLRRFQSEKRHMATVVDEYGSTVGIITLEDVLEEIVGEIEDEFDDKDGQSSIYTLADGGQRVAGDTPVATVNGFFDVALPTDEFDTIGGLVAQKLGRVPRRGESVTIAGLAFTVMLARGGAVRWFKVTRAAEEALGSDGA